LRGNNALMASAVGSVIFLGLTGLGMYSHFHTMQYWGPVV